MAPLFTYGLLSVVLMGSVAYLLPVRILVGMVLTDTLLTLGAAVLDAAFCAPLPSLATVCRHTKTVCRHLMSGQCRYSNETQLSCALHNETLDEALVVQAYCQKYSLETTKDRVRVRECCHLSCKFAADAVFAIVWLIVFTLMVVEVLFPAPQLPEVIQQALQLGPPPRPAFDRRRG